MITNQEEFEWEQCHTAAEQAKWCLRRSLWASHDITTDDNLEDRLRMAVRHYEEDLRELAKT